MEIMKYFAYLIAVLFISLGIAILAGYLIKDSAPSQFRIMIGIVLILYGAFRFTVTFFKKKETSDI
jgi:prolipoprotein diacylglyceryltransferase